MDQSDMLSTQTVINEQALHTENMLSPARSCSQGKLIPHTCRHGERCCLTPQSSHRSMTRAAHVVTECATGIPPFFSERADDGNEATLNRSEHTSTSSLLGVALLTVQGSEPRHKWIQKPLLPSKKVVHFHPDVCVLCDEHDLCECVVPLCVDPKSPTSDGELSPPESQTQPQPQSSSEQEPLQVQQVTRHIDFQQESVAEPQLTVPASSSMTCNLHANRGYKETCTGCRSPDGSRKVELNGHVRRPIGRFRDSNGPPSYEAKDEHDDANVQVNKSRSIEVSSGSYKSHLQASSINSGGTAVSRGINSKDRAHLWLGGDSSLNTSQTFVNACTGIVKEDETSRAVSEICPSDQHRKHCSQEDTENGLSSHQQSVKSGSESEGHNSRRYKRGYEWLQGFSSTSNSLSD